MVRAVGIEPTLLAERDFESRASTNSTTPALACAYSAIAKSRNEKHRCKPWANSMSTHAYFNVAAINLCMRECTESLPAST